MSHYFDKNPRVRSPTESEFTAVLRGKRITLKSASGMFSMGKLDRGAEVLVEYADLHDGQQVLDLGCSYGTVGIALAKSFEVDMHMTDINKTVFRYVKINAEANKVMDKISYQHSDGFEKIDKTFDVILYNPPQHAGKDTCIRLIDESFEHLNTDGSLQLVCRHNTGGASFEKYMNELFGNVETLCKKSGYRVYKSVKKN